jgi:hypothetical protein
MSKEQALQILAHVCALAPVPDSVNKQWKDALQVISELIKNDKKAEANK